MTSSEQPQDDKATEGSATPTLPLTHDSHPPQTGAIDDNVEAQQIAGMGEEGGEDLE